ncbi:erythromycin esterase family protein [Halovenus rubra]|uniref:Erythromycin esterase family protein n=2 Tax=Halovenus rubra TaxID=869890 RepID=A0ABD5X3S0_9EURY|nr:erythromycin esterase family protein [Halovenus rubra]
MSRHALPVSIDDSIDTTEFTGDTRDLAVIDDQVSEASIIGLGEAGHGLRDCYTLKHRLFARLVTEHDFRLFGIETHLAEALPINEYVVHGEGDAESALEALEFWVWQTDAVKSLIEWMREFNDGRPMADRIRFYGFDVQSTKAPAAELGGFLEQVDPAFGDEIGGALDVARKGIKPTNRDGEQDASEEEVRNRIDTVEELVEDLGDRFDARKDEYVEATDKRAYRMASQHVQLLEQATELAAVVLEAGYGHEYGWRRDEYMAENVAWIREFEESDRLAIWAANGHLQKGNAHPEDPPDCGPLGYHLDQRFGDEYCAFGIEFGRGTVRTVDTRDASVEFPAKELRAPATDTLVGALFELFSEPQYLDLSAVTEGDDLTEWLEDAQTRAFGPTYDPEIKTGLESDYRVDFTWEFDGLFFVPEIEAAEPLSMVTSRATDE